jgi:hypothetical protein
VSFEHYLAAVRNVTPAQLAYMAVPQPWELQAVYESGFNGLATPPTARMLAQAKPLYEAVPWVKGLGAGRLNLPALAILKFEPTFGHWEPQTIGTCTSHGLRNAGMGDYCVDALCGETEYKGRFCTENLYAARGWAGEGSDPETLASYVGPNGKGGFLVRQKYLSQDGRETVDLSTFSSTTERWAASRGRYGNPAWLDAIAASNKALSIAVVTTPEEERDAHALGFGTLCGCDYSFSNVTNQDGVAERTAEGWSHAMARLGTDDTSWARTKYSEMLCLIIQSWGRWNSVKGQPPHWKSWVPGSFLVRAKHSGGMLKQGWGCVVGNVQGFDRSAWDYLATRAERLREATTEWLDAQSRAHYYGV